MTVLDDKKRLERLIRNLNFVFREAQERTKQQAENLEDFNPGIRSRYDEINYQHYMSEIYRKMVAQAISNKRELMQRYGIKTWED